MISSEKTILVAGASGLVGSSLLRLLAARDHRRVLSPTSGQLDLTDARLTRQYFEANHPDAVILAAAFAGGIGLNIERPADLLERNLAIETNVIRSAFDVGVEKLILIGSACVYPRDAMQPMPEEYILSGPLEPTVEYYALAKLAGIKLCESYWRQHGCNFYTLTPPNLYGPYDRFESERAHVLPSLVSRFHAAKISREGTVTVWGSGKPRREFMHVDDVASAVVFAFENIDADQVYQHGISHLNVGTGTDITIRELADLIRDTVGFEGEIEFDLTKPDGAQRKLLDVSRIQSLGWRHQIDLSQGLQQTYDWFEARRRQTQRSVV
jgi:GDP-L-fucose synthase